MGTTLDSLGDQFPSSEAKRPLASAPLVTAPLVTAPLASAPLASAPLTIERALRELCNIPGKMYFVAAMENDNSITYFSSPASDPQINFHAFFNSGAFAKEVRRIERVRNGSSSFDGPELGFNPEMHTPIYESSRTDVRDQYYQPIAADGSTSDNVRRPRKRQRTNSDIPSGRGMSMATTEASRGIKIGDVHAVYAFYDHYLKCCQQTACKTLGKAWVKAIAPKKQSTNPYTKGDETRPDWWPKFYRKFGCETWKNMRHKEPDHLGKDVVPETERHPALQKVELDLEKLHAVTLEALSSWFTDKNSPGNQKKKTILDDIFKVAKQELRYNDGEIDANTEVLVESFSDNERYKEAESDDEEDAEQHLTMASSGTSSMEPIGPNMMPQVHANEHGETRNFPGTGFPQNANVRATQYSHPGYEHGLCEHPDYVDGSSIGNHAPNYSHGHIGLHEVYHSPHGTSRRSSAFASSDYESSGVVPGLYHPSWPTSNTPNTPSMYAFQQQLPSVPTFSGQIPPGPPYLSQQPPDAHHADILTPRGVNQSGIQRQSAYPDYPNEGASLLGPIHVKTERGHPTSISQ
ncbi:hypothetical protein F4825DRAFT_453693 [Nemania diffusa]|nr:hypothetical protein F4825DRAFT_453693 [Nemania diffusa]